jgi:hypothetical protein
VTRLANSAAATTGATFAARMAILERRHCLICQHASGDRDWSKWRLGRDLGARQRVVASGVTDAANTGRSTWHQRMAPKHITHGSPDV